MNGEENVRGGAVSTATANNNAKILSNVEITDEHKIISKFQVQGVPPTKAEVDEYEKNKEDPAKWMKERFEKDKLASKKKKKKYEKAMKDNGYFTKTDPATILAYQLDTPEKIGKWVRKRQAKILAKNS